MSSVDIAQTEKYKLMLGLTNIYNTTESTTLIGNTTINSDLFVSGETILHNDATIRENLYVENNLTSNSVLLESGNMQSITSINNILQANDYNCQNLLTIGNLNISNSSSLEGIQIEDCYVGSALSVQNITVHNIISNNGTLLNIFSDTITIGDHTSIITLNGDVTYNITGTVRMRDKNIVINKSGSEVDDIGFQIFTDNTSGFIKTNSTGDRFILKAPDNNYLEYIATLDNNDNLFVSGITILEGSSTILNQLNVSGNASIFGSTAFNDSVLIAGNAIFGNDITMLSTADINGDLEGNNITITGNFTVNGTAIVNSLEIEDTLNVGSNILIDGSTTFMSGLNIYGETKCKGIVTVNSNLYTQNDLDIRGNVTVLNDMIITSTTNISGDIVISDDIVVTGKTLLNGSSTVSSDLKLTNTLVIDGNATIGSLFGQTYNDFLKNYSTMSNINVLGDILCSLPNYVRNSDAIAAGLDLWQVYRTGGILKVRLDPTPPTMTLTGASLIEVDFSDNYTEPGVDATDNVDSTLPVYITSLSNNLTSNIITSPYIINTNDTITTSTVLDVGQYTIVYYAEDSSGNISYINRTLDIAEVITHEEYSTTSKLKQSVNTGGQHKVTGTTLSGGLNSTWTRFYIR